MHDDEKADGNDDLAPLLRALGYRMTGPRRLVWAVLRSARGHLTAEQIASRVNEIAPTVNLSSVYRTLALFSDLDLVRESQLGPDGASRWEPAHPDDHFHLVCESCGDVEHHAGDLVDQVRTHLAASHRFRVNEIDLVVTGICRSCAGE